MWNPHGFPGFPSENDMNQWVLQMFVPIPMKAHPFWAGFDKINPFWLTIGGAWHCHQAGLDHGDVFLTKKEKWGVVGQVGQPQLGNLLVDTPIDIYNMNIYI